MAATRLRPGTKGNRPVEQAPLSTDSIFETLSNRRRRYVLHYLTRVAEPVTIRDLSEQLAAWENEVDRSQVRPKERKRLYTALHQTHLPKMDELGIVTYNRDRGVVELSGPVEQFDIYFSLVGPDEIPWSQFYLALGSLYTLLVAAAVVGIPPLGSLDGIVLALGGALLFTGVGIVHVFGERRRQIGGTDQPPEPGTVPMATDLDDEPLGTDDRP